SRDLVAWLAVGAAVSTIPDLVKSMTHVTGTAVVRVASIAENPEPELALALLGEAMGGAAPALVPLLIAVLLAAVAATAAQGGIHRRKLFSQVKQMNPLTGFQRLFGKAALWEGAKALLKTVVVAGVIALVVQGLVPVLMSAGALS